MNGPSALSEDESSAVSDMLVNLLKLTPREAVLAELAAAGVTVRRAQTFELTPVRRFVEEHFTLAWADEITAGFARRPVSVYIATRNGEIVGFGAYECTARAFFGPTGVRADERGRGIGKALLVACLWGLREMGYAYGIIGGGRSAHF